MKWYLLQAKPRQDAIAEENLRRQKYICYRPLCRVENNSTGRIIVREESLFPGYLFIRLGEDDNWSPIRSTIGVKALVRFGECALPVPDSLIAALVDREKVDGVLNLFEAGQKILIKDGAFAGLEAIFCCKIAKDRVLILLNILDRNQHVSVPASMIAAC